MQRYIYGLNLEIEKIDPKLIDHGQCLIYNAAKTDVLSLKAGYKIIMTSKRREFIDRLLRISEINEELLEFSEKNKQPATTKRIKLVQMGKAEFNLPSPSTSIHPSKHNCKVLVVDRHPPRYHS